MISLITTIGWVIFGCVLVLTIGYCVIFINKQETEKEIRLKEIDLELMKERTKR